MSKNHLAKLQMTLALGALTRIAEGLEAAASGPKENVGEKIDQVLEEAKQDLKGVKRVDEICQLLDVPDK